MSDPHTESRRTAAVRDRAAQRLRSQRDMLRPLGWAVTLLVVAGAVGGRPRPGVAGRALGVSLALLTFAIALALAIRPPFSARRHWFQGAVIAAMGAAGTALVALQSQGTSELAGGAAVWMALARLPLPLGLPLGLGITAAVDVATGLAGGSATAVLASTLVMVLLGLVAYFIKQARASQDNAELLLAQLEDAREEQTRAAAVAERNRIAGELHDVLAHSLSGAAIQLQAARKLAEREQAAASLRAAIDRAGELVKQGLTNARQAVGALRGDELPGIDQLASLVAGVRRDLGTEVSMTVEGAAQPLSADASLALYRGAQEALTNVARYAPNAPAAVVLRYRPGHVTLIVENRAPAASDTPALEGLDGVGGGHGLMGLRERVEQTGGSLRAGPTEGGWRVEVEVPA